MSFRFHASAVGRAVAVFAVLGISGAVGYGVLSGFRHSNSISAMKCDLRSPAGVQLASIFEGARGDKLDATLVNSLLVEAKAPPRDPCHADRKSSWSKVSRLFAMRSVLAQSDCDSPCSSHYNSQEFFSLCSDFYTLCQYGIIYQRGCEGAEFTCDDGSHQCGQRPCPNP
jgi:hypothetical protein